MDDRRPYLLYRARDRAGQRHHAADRAVLPSPRDQQPAIDPAQMCGMLCWDQRADPVAAIAACLIGQYLGQIGADAALRGFGDVKNPHLPSPKCR
ncbi:hypothetical protein BRX36_11970 [Sphingomonas sp. S-NIH.Pt1_0416]|nr:hypothetical protein BRX36_11970 [Sphingomonas sp. S-NIH.Pt1_0416]